MKWAALAILLAAIVPFAGWLRHNTREVPKVWILMGFLPFCLGEFHLYMATISWPGWPGYVKGTEISIMDVLAIALYLSLPRTTCALPFKLPMVLYFIAAVLSVFQTAVPMASIFYAWQLARMFLVYAVVTKASADKRVAPAILTGMTIGLCFEACFAIWERFGLGILQVGGTIGDKNYLGLMSHFVTFPCIALLLAGERGWQPVAGPVAGLITAILTVSRATVGLLGIGSVALFGLSAIRQWNRRKSLVLVAGVAIAGVLTPLMLSSFTDRFDAQQNEGAYDERAAFEKAAGMMISDHPMGVGANYYVVAANNENYNSRAGVAWIVGSDSTNVHNIYYLVAAETGYLGLVTFVLLLLRPLVVAFRCGWMNRGDERGDLLLGLGMALFMVYVHSYFEWIFITFQAQYMFALEVGLIAGLATQLGYWRLSGVSNRIVAVTTVAPEGT